MPATDLQGSENGVEIKGKMHPGFEKILTPEALGFLGRLHRTFDEQRQKLLQQRVQRQNAIDSGQNLDFLRDTQHIRESEWQVKTILEDLQNRRIEITGPVDRKMIINALNSGADMFMADFEDANSPTWQNVIEGQINLFDAVRRQIRHTDTKKNKEYTLHDSVATLLVRPRGWHLPEKHIEVDGHPMSASLVDFGLYFFHNARELLSRNTGPYFYLPKLESHLEARLWNNVFGYASDVLGIVHDSIKATVLIETIHAAFEMDEILYELRDHITGLNAGRWDYIFSAIKTFRNREDILFPDRDQISMSVPFMKAYTDLLVKTCHRRGAHAIGGMAAFIPTKNDTKANELALQRVQQDKERESNDGFDGTWIAHPGLVDVARAPFDQKLGKKPHQKDVLRDDVEPSADALLNFKIPEAHISEQGLRTNINVGIQYIESWLQGVGAAAIYNLMEDAATAEISRSQVWQWLHNTNAQLEDGRAIDARLYRQLVGEELKNIRQLVGDTRFESGKFKHARKIFDQIVTDDEFPRFFTLVAYEALD